MLVLYFFRFPYQHLTNVLSCLHSVCSGRPPSYHHAWGCPPSDLPLLVRVDLVWFYSLDFPYGRGVPLDGIQLPDFHVGPQVWWRVVRYVRHVRI